MQPRVHRGIVGSKGELLNRHLFRRTFLATLAQRKWYLVPGPFPRTNNITKRDV